MLKAALRDSSIYGFSSILSKGISIFLLPIYTRALSATGYGAYELVLTLGALANFVVALEVSQGLVRYWGDIADQATRLRLASTVLWFTTSMYIIFMVIGEVFSVELSVFLLGTIDFLIPFRWGLVFIALNGIYYLLLNQLRSELKSVGYAFVSLCYAATALVFAGIFCLLLKMGLVGVLIGQILALGMSILLSAWILRKSLGFYFDQKLLSKMLLFSMPLVPAGLAIFVSLYINRLALSRFSTLDEVGLFGIGSRIAGVIGLLIVGIQGALMPLIYKHYREVDAPEKIAKLFNWFLAIALVGCLTLSLFSNELLIIFATPAYLGGANLVVYLAPALLLSQMYIFAPGIGIKKKTHWQLWIALLAAMVSILGNWLMVPIWGIIGAALATLLSSLVFLVAWVITSQGLYHIPYQWKGVAIAVSVYIACSIIGVKIISLDLMVFTGLAIKCVLILSLIFVEIYASVLPKNDIHRLSQYAQQYLTRCLKGKMFNGHR